MDCQERDQSARGGRCHSISFLHFPLFFNLGVGFHFIQAPTLHVDSADFTTSDFSRLFICGEVMQFNRSVALASDERKLIWHSLKEHGSEAAVKAAGGYRQQGRSYEIVDGDIWYVSLSMTLKLRADLVATGSAANR